MPAGAGRQRVSRGLLPEFIGRRAHREEAALRQTVVGVLALQGDVREHSEALRAVGATPVPVRQPRELDLVEGLVIPGGESTTISRLADVFELREPIVRRIAAGMPVYGSCAGMIMLAESIMDGRADQRPFGGIDIVVRRNAFGRQVDSFETEVTMARIVGAPVRGVFIRAPWVEHAGPHVEVLARLSRGISLGSGAHEKSTVPGPPEATKGPGTIIAVRQGNLLATAFHPELTGDTRVHALFAAMTANASQHAVSQ